MLFPGRNADIERFQTFSANGFKPQVDAQLQFGLGEKIN
jgi:hypothetical protein